MLMTVTAFLVSPPTSSKGGDFRPHPTTQINTIHGYSHRDSHGPCPRQSHAKQPVFLHSKLSLLSLHICTKWWHFIISNNKKLLYPEGDRKTSSATVGIFLKREKDNKMIQPESDIKNLLCRLPFLHNVMDCRETFWLNHKYTTSTAESLAQLSLTRADINDALERLNRFSPFIEQLFPETAPASGLIESPLIEIPRMKSCLDSSFKKTIPGRLLLKCDNLLPVSGSIKARGGIYEVLHFAEKTALKEKLIHPGENYTALASPKARNVFSRYRIAVGSTGNLGLSIGIMGKALGMAVTVHMSADAKNWKKALLRKHGVEVIEHSGNYSDAVAAGRRQAETDPTCHFVDDENSPTLFLGYSTAASRLQPQLKRLDIPVDGSHPLCVYLPCGVGGGPGGISFGLKHIFGDNVHCFFAEPTHAPAMLLGLSSGLHNRISASDLNIDGKTEADGLAVGRPSGFVGQLMQTLIAGVFTVEDYRLRQLIQMLYQQEKIFVEPSAAAGFPGPWDVSLQQWHRLDHKGISPTHLIWATGGGMVPNDEREIFLDR